jgi:uncharacterized protein YqfB (UPF0267 family)
MLTVLEAVVRKAKTVLCRQSSEQDVKLGDVKARSQLEDKTMIPKPVIVKWADITTYMVWNESAEQEMCVFETIGFLIEETEDYYKLCDTAPDIGQVTKYPKGCIIEITELKK